MIIHQIIKTFIPVAFCILFGMSAFLYSGSGPLWMYQGSAIISNCNTYWWTNLLFISNIYPWSNTYISSTEQCLPWFWYVSTEF